MAKHKYGAFCYTYSNKFKEMRKLFNALNWASRHFGEIIAEVTKQIEEGDIKSAEDRKAALSYIPVFQYLLNYDRINLWNPIVGNDPMKPNMDEARLLSVKSKATAEEYLESEDIQHFDLSDVERLRVGHLTNWKKGGIGVFRLSQIVYGICELFLADQNLHFIGDETAEQIQNGEFDDVFLRLASEYHTSSSKTTKKKKDADNDVPTLEQFEEGELKPSQLETETLEQYYKETESSGKKAAITRELKQREEAE